MTLPPAVTSEAGQRRHPPGEALRVRDQVADLAPRSDARRSGTGAASMASNRQLDNGGTHNMKRTSILASWLILVAVLGLVVTACSSSSETEITSAAADRALGNEASPVGYSAGEGDNDAGTAPEEPSAAGEEGKLDASDGTAAQVAFSAVDLGRDIIYRAELTVAVTDVAQASTTAVGIVESLGGYLYGQQSTGGPTPTSLLTFKVLPADFQDALARLGELGEVRVQNVSTEDVTERVVDLESRIRTAETSVTRLRALLESATDLEDVALLESQLLDRETTLETLRGQLRTVQDQVALATIVLSLTEALSAPDLQLTVTGYAGHNGGGSCPEEPSLRVDEGEDVTLCFRVVNAGDTPLTGLELTDTVLDLELGDLLVVYGDPSAVLDPGQDLMLAAEVVAERDLRTRTKVSATPVDQEGHPVVGRTTDTTVAFSVDTVDPGGLPGFGDGVAASWSMLQTVGGAVVVSVGWLLPLVWVFLLAGLFLWWRRRRSRRGTPDAGAPDDVAAETPAE